MSTIKGYDAKTNGWTKSVIQKMGGVDIADAFLRGEYVLTKVVRDVDSIVISIDRTTPFDPVAFAGEGWSIVEEDERSLKISEIDLTKISLKTKLKDGEDFIVGEENLKRFINSDDIRLDAKVLQTLLENKHLIPDSWKNKINGETPCIYFYGTILREDTGKRYVMCLMWHDNDNEWTWWSEWLDVRWHDHDPSAVLEC